MPRAVDRILSCPSCQEALSAKLTCKACGFRVELIDDILDLRTDKSFDTLLDTASYDATHGVRATPETRTSGAYFEILEQQGLRPSGRLLEIAAGSGFLTASLLVSERFDEIHCGDISAAFMRQLARRTEAISSSTGVTKYLFDANHLPFGDESFDYVFGNSVLHHFAHFENTIRDAFRVLKPGGAAVFAEPILDTHALVSLAAGLIARSVVASGTEKTAGMTPRHLRALQIIQNRVTLKMGQLKGDRDSLQEVEDKFVFPAEFLRRLGNEIGFSRVVLAPAPEGFDLGQEIRNAIDRVFNLINLSTEPLDAHAHVFEAFSVDYGRSMADYTLPVFTRIAFIR